MSVALNKASILLLYLRIMPQRYYRVAIYSLLILVGLFAVATTIAGIFQCMYVLKPFSYCIQLAGWSVEYIVVMWLT
jgi:hypothetical protein